VKPVSGKGFKAPAEFYLTPESRSNQTKAGGIAMKKLMEYFNGYYHLERAKDFLKNEEGQTLVEYALILVLIAIVVLLMLTGMGKSVNNTFSTVNNALQPTGG